MALVNPKILQHFHPYPLPLKKKNHFPLPPEYLSWCATYKVAGPHLAGSPLGICSLPDTVGLAPDRLIGRTSLEARHGFFSKARVKLEMSWQLGQRIQSQGFKPIHLSCWLAQLLRMPTSSSLGLILWNKVWNVQKGEIQKNRRAHHHLSPYVLAWPALPSRREKIFWLCRCEFYFTFLLPLSYTSGMKERNWKSTTFTRLCVYHVLFSERGEKKERAVQGLAEVQSYCFLISRQPWGFLSLFSISFTVQKCALSLVFILGSLT